MDKPLVLIKIGGRPAADAASLAHLITEMAALADTAQFILVHGGGTAVSAMQKEYGLEPRFIDGIRQTTPQEMVLVDAALAGQVNTSLVRRFHAAGLSAVGLSGCDGGLTRAEAIAPESRTGRITRTNPALVKTLLNAGYLPVISPVSQDAAGEGLNINADEAALAIAAALPAHTLLFISDIPGILKEGRVLTNLTPLGIEEEIETGTITGGMIPKTRSSLRALQQGVAAVTIGGYTAQGDLESLLEGRRGSRIIRG